MYKVSLIIFNEQIAYQHEFSSSSAEVKNAWNYISMATYWTRTVRDK
jgi:hypothetical protein